MKEMGLSRPKVDIAWVAETDSREPTDHRRASRPEVRSAGAPGVGRPTLPADRPAPQRGEGAPPARHAGRPPPPPAAAQGGGWPLIQ